MAYKVLNHLINGKVGFKYIELFIGKPDILNKFINLVKYSFKCFINNNRFNLLSDPVPLIGLCR